MRCLVLVAESSDFALLAVVYRRKVVPSMDRSRDGRGSESNAIMVGEKCPIQCCHDRKRGCVFEGCLDLSELL